MEKDGKWKKGKECCWQIGGEENGRKKSKGKPCRQVEFILGRFLVAVLILCLYIFLCCLFIPSSYFSFLI